MIKKTSMDFFETDLNEGTEFFFSHQASIEENTFNVDSESYVKAFKNFLDGFLVAKKIVEAFAPEIQEEVYSRIKEGISAESYQKACEDFFHEHHAFCAIYSALARLGKTYCVGGVIRSIILNVVAQFFISLFMDLYHQKEIMDFKILADCFLNMHETINDYDLVTTISVEDTWACLTNMGMEPYIKKSLNIPNTIILQYEDKSHLRFDIKGACQFNHSEEIKKYLSQGDFTCNAVLLDFKEHGVSIIDPFAGLRAMICKELIPITSSIFKRPQHVLRVCYFRALAYKYEGIPFLQSQEETPLYEGSSSRLVALKKELKPSAKKFLLGLSKEAAHHSLLHTMKNIYNRGEGQFLRFLDCLKEIKFIVPEGDYPPKKENLEEMVNTILIITRRTLFCSSTVFSFDVTSTRRSDQQLSF